MPRPRKSSLELKLSQSRTGRIKQRLAEESAALGIVPEVASTPRYTSPSYSMDGFLTKVRAERDSFESRIVPGQAVMLELGPVRFNWRGDHSLTLARAHAESERANNPDCQQFLNELSGNTDFVCDPVACENITTWLNVLTGGPHWELTHEQNFYLVQANGWKKKDGSDRHDESYWESFTHRNILAAGKKLVREQL